MRRAPAWRPHHVARFPFKFVRLPVDSVGAAFNDNLAPIFRHHAKETVTVYDSECFRSRINPTEHWRPFRFRLERAVNQPRIERQGENDDNRRSVNRESVWYREFVATALCRRVLDAINTGASTERGGYSVIDQQQTERDREQVEKAIIPRRRNHDLQKNEEPTGKQPQSARRPNEKWDDNFDDETERDRKFLER